MWFKIQQYLGNLLNFSLVRLLWFERWFRYAFIAFVLVFVVVGLSLPKIWRTSEPGFLPVIKVSGLDLLQVWSLRRTAMKAAAAGKFEEANYAWIGALANNQADPDLVRGSLRNILQDPKRRERVAQAVQQSFWLLRLTRTNVSDLELTSRVFADYRYYEPIAEMVETLKEPPTPGLTVLFFKALFNLGRMDEFNARWNKLDGTLQKDPELALYRAAYLAGWGPPGTITEGRQQLQAAEQNPDLKKLAFRLQLAVSARELNPSDYGQALRKLEEVREDTLSDHAGYWRLLVMTSQKEEAARLVQAYPHPPTSAIEVVELAQIHFALGSHEEGFRILDRYARDFGHASIYWITYASELMATKRWEELRQLALRIRAEEGSTDQLTPFTYFLEGRAELALGREASADESFAKAAEREFAYAGLGFRVANELFQLGRPVLAKQILQRLEKALGADASYWILVFTVADRLQDVDLLVQAATRAYELRPHDPALINNYAAALIISRQNPQEVVRVTLDLFTRNPNSLHALVNHSAALLLNNRHKEAHALLSRVRTNSLNAAQMALYNLDMFEVYVGLEQYDEAWAIADQIELKRLYPTQRVWFESVRQQMPPRSKSG